MDLGDGVKEGRPGQGFAANGNGHPTRSVGGPYAELVNERHCPPW